MAEDLGGVARNLNELVKTTRTAESAFGGLGKSIASIANSTSQASKNWTIFSRLVSGTPIWAVQNKIRAYIDILAQVDEKQIQNNESRKKFSKSIIDEMKSYDAVQGQMIDITTQFEKYAQVQSAFGGLFSGVENLTLETRELLKSTDSYTLAIKAGYTEFEAYSKAMEEVSTQFDILEKNATRAEKALQFERKMQSSEGRKEIRDEQRKQTFDDMVEGLNDFGDKTADLLDKIFRQNGKGITLAQISAKTAEKYDKISTKFQTKMLGFAKFTNGVFKLLQKYIIMGMFVAMGIIAAIAIIKLMSERLDFGNMIEEIGTIISLVSAGVGQLVGLLGALMGGDLDNSMLYLSQLLDTAISIGVKALMITLTIGYEFIIAAIRLIPALIASEEYRSALRKILVKALMIYLALITIKMIAVAMMQVVAIYALPALIGIAVGLVVLAAIERLFKNVNVFGKRATGGMVNENMTLVGERGPELVSLPRGSFVHTNSESKKMVGGTNNTFNITINAKDTSDAELRRIAEKIGNMVNNKINRSFSSTTMR
tara:strand:+ start:535 stop:2163 length:1629 start_codon:yes stop_codon:yes gene_type:complete